MIKTTRFQCRAWLPVLLAIACLGQVAPVHAARRPAVAAAASISALASQIDAQIQQARFTAASWGIDVVSLDSGRTLYTHRPGRLLQPASTAKLFTAALSLSTLGADYRMATRVLSAGTLRNGRLNGSLILYGMGDPTLGTDSSANWAEQLAAQLAARGVKSVHGDLIGDDSYFTGSPFGAGWEADDLQSWFAVPSSSLSVQENILEATINPANRAGFPATVEIAAGDNNPAVAGQIMTSSRNERSDINLYRAPGNTTLYAFGSVPAQSVAQHFKLAVPDPALRATRLLRNALATRGISISGRVLVLHWPQDDASLLAHTQPLAEVSSPPLLDILQRGLKRSQNLYLQNLLLSVGAHDQAASGDQATGFLSTQDWAIKAMHRMLASFGISPSSSLLGEGTGLSRRDLVTPEAMVQLLVGMARQPWGASLQQALPIAGVDGTLAAHMHRTAADGNVHAKTGSMTYVHCLAGYVTTAAGEHVAFAIMLNNYKRPEGAPRIGSDVNAIAEMLAAFRGHS